MNNNQKIMDRKMLFQKAPSKSFNFLLLVDNLLSNIDNRSQEIIKKRFGIFLTRKETLEKIGEQHSITRERVRQIIGEVIRKISNNSNDHFLEAEKKIIFTINKNNGIIKKSDISEKFSLLDEREANAISFFVSCSKNIFEFEESGIFKKTWASSKDIFPEIKKTILEAEKIIARENKLFTNEEILENLTLSFPEFKKDQILSYLETAHHIERNKFGKWGMADWMEVNPKGTREKIYLVLKEHQKPLHFTQIAKLIDEYKLGKRKAHPQTIHNELIKDNRFILIGRGIYALLEWGYFEGTIREVIKKILEKNGKPMDKDEIIEEILKIRKVKKATIMINLNNRNFFKKDGNFYSIKK